MGEIQLSNGKTVNVRHLKAADAFKLADYEKASEQSEMLVHVATKMPLEEIRELEIEDLQSLLAELHRENPKIGRATDFPRTVGSEKSG